MAIKLLKQILWATKEIELCPSNFQWNEGKECVAKIPFRQSKIRKHTPPRFCHSGGNSIKFLLTLYQT